MNRKECWFYLMMFSATVVMISWRLIYDGGDSTLTTALVLFSWFVGVMSERIRR